MEFFNRFARLKFQKMFINITNIEAMFDIFYENKNKFTISSEKYTDNPFVCKAKNLKNRNEFTIKPLSIKNCYIYYQAYLDYWFHIHNNNLNSPYTHISIHITDEEILYLISAFS